MLHNTFWILKQRPGRSLAVVVSTQVVQSIQQPHYRFVQRGGQKQYSMYFSQVVGWQVVSREAAPFPETSWHSSWRARGQPGQQIQTNQLRNTNVQINANESIQNVDFIFFAISAWRLLWANRFLGMQKISHTKCRVCVCGWILQSWWWHAQSHSMCTILEPPHRDTTWALCTKEPPLLEKSILYFFSVRNNRCLGTASHSARAGRWIESTSNNWVSNCLAWLVFVAADAAALA